MYTIYLLRISALHAIHCKQQFFASMYQFGRKITQIFSLSRQYNTLIVNSTKLNTWCGNQFGQFKSSWVFPGTSKNSKSAQGPGSSQGPEPSQGPGFSQGPGSCFPGMPISKVPHTLHTERVWKLYNKMDQVINNMQYIHSRSMGKVCLKHILGLL